MSWWRSLFRGERGQALAIIAGGMVGLLAMVALVVDVGNAYTLQRRVRNAVDAAALAGARELANQEETTNGQVLQAAVDYAVANGMREEDVAVWYADAEGNPLQAVPNDGFAPPTSVNGVAVSSVLVQASGTVGTYFAHLLGVSSFTARQDSLGLVLCGACSAGSDGLFPVAVRQSLFDGNGGKPESGQIYTIWGDQTAPGNFGWVSWDDSPGHTSEETLVANLSDLKRSGTWRVGDLLPTGPGVKNSQNVTQALQRWIDKSVTVPIYDQVTGQGANTRYRIVGFARMRLTGFNFEGRDKYITGQFENWVERTGEGGCVDLGVCAVKLRPPMTERRSIAGVVSIWEPRLSERVVPAVQHIPVDVVNVLDISGSMNDRWGPGQEVKLSTAKAVLTEFNNYLVPAEGDRVGLVTFPTISRGAWYGLACTGSWHRYYYRGYVRSQLTSDVQAVNNIIQMLSANGGTPIASAMQLARAVALPDGEPTPGRVPVIILASDGLANCTVDGRWTGFDGMTYNPPPCNGLAEQQALEQANIAKQAGIIVFTIAMGDSFNSDLLRAMATADTDPSKPHFFVANTGQDLRAIYLSLAQRINNIGGECNVEEFESSGEYAQVSLYKDGELYATTTASATGSYVFTDVEPGTYSFAVTMQKNGLTFDVLTKLIGGPPAEEPITITVGQGVGTYVKDLYLRTSTPLQCR